MTLNPYMVWIKVGALVALFLVGCGLGWYFNGLRGKAALETERRQVAEDARLQIEQAEKRAYDADEALRKAQQSSPKAAPRIREVTRANPSGCNVPVPVARKLRDAIRDGNKSVSG